MEIPCKFVLFPYKYGEKFYGCWIQNQQIPEDRELKFTAKHKEGKTNYDVHHIQFKNCTVTKVPQGLKKIFPNLKNLEIWNSKLKKVSKHDLMEYKYIEKLSFKDNDLEFLPGDLLEGFEYLNFVTFSGNKLGVVEPNILDGLDQLKYVTFRYNPNYNINYSIHPIYEPNATIQEIKNDLHEKYFSRFKFLRDMKNSADELEKYKERFKSLENQIKSVGKIGHSTSELYMEMEQLKITIERTSKTLYMRNLK